MTAKTNDLSRLLSNCTPLASVPPWRRLLGRALYAVVALIALWMAAYSPLIGMVIVGAVVCGPIVGAVLLVDRWMARRAAHRSIG